MPGVAYICSQCGKTIIVTTRDDVRCTQCGCMILYKKRTPDRTYYQAR